MNESQSLCDHADTPITVAAANAVKQDHEGLTEALFRLRDERIEFKSEGWCGPMCPCQVKCHA